MSFTVCRDGDVYEGVYEGERPIADTRMDYGGRVPCETKPEL